MNFIKRLLPKVACTISVLFLFNSCKKKDNGNPSGFVMHNLLDKKMNFELYRSVADYYAHTNAKIKGYVEAGGVLSIPYDSVQDLTSNYLMFIDWYSDDFAYSNWGYNVFYSNYNSDWPRLELSSGDKTDYYIRTPCTARVTFISGQYGDKTFKFADCYSVADSIHSLWPSLTAEEKKSELRFNFNLLTGFSYTYFDSTGAPHIITDQVSPSTYGNYITFMGDRVGLVQNCSSPNIQSNRYSKDTIRLRDGQDRLQIYVPK